MHSVRSSSDSDPTSSPADTLAAAPRQRLETFRAIAAGAAEESLRLFTQVSERLGAAEAMLSDLHPARRELAAARRIVARTIDLHRRVAALSGGEAGRAEVDLPVLVQEALPLLRALLPSNVELRLQPDLEGGAVALDAVAFQEVLFTLVLNAGRAIGPAGGVIRLQLSRRSGADVPRAEFGTPGPGEYLCLTVTDTAGATGGRPGSRASTWAGSAALASLVRLQQGTLALHPESEDGTSVSVFLPEVPRAAPRVRQAPAALGASLPRIAIVDDEETVVKLATQALDFSGYRAHALPSAEVCLARLLREPGSFDLVITDQRLPALTGTDLVQRLREAGVMTPVLITSGSISSVTAGEIQRLRPARFLAKPFTLGELLGTVRELLAEAPPPAVAR